jgi:hypothetical protein
MKRVGFVVSAVLVLLVMGCDPYEGLPIVFVDPDVSMYSWKDSDPESLVVAVVVNANPYTAFGGLTTETVRFDGGYTVECYDITTDDPIGELNSGATVSFTYSEIGSWVGEYIFPYGVSDITATDELAIKVIGTIGVVYGDGSSLTAAPYAFEEILFLTAP